MKPTQPKSTPARGAAWILGAPALAIVATFVLALAGAAPDESGADWIGAAWLAAVLWTIAASFVQALWQGLRHGDWSAFTCCDLPGKTTRTWIGRPKPANTPTSGSGPPTRTSCARASGFSRITITAIPAPDRRAGRPLSAAPRAVHPGRRCARSRRGARRATRRSAGLLPAPVGPSAGFVPTPPPRGPPSTAASVDRVRSTRSPVRPPIAASVSPRDTAAEIRPHRPAPPLAPRVLCVALRPPPYACSAPAVCVSCRSSRASS